MLANNTDMTETLPSPATHVRVTRKAKLAVIWVDWYAYHIARFRALTEHPALRGRVAGIELVGGVGVHEGLMFRCPQRNDLPISTLLPSDDWASAGQRRLAKLLWQELDAIDPSSILVPGYYTLPGIAAALWGRLHRRQVILMTESSFEDRPRMALKESAKGLLIRSLFSHAIFGGIRHRRYLERLGFPSDRMGERYDVVDNDFFRQQCADLRAKASPADFGLPERYFLFVGRVAEEKNVGGLLRAYVKYRSTGGKWPLVVVGHGPAMGLVEGVVGGSAVFPHVHFAGMKRTEELVPYYAFAGAHVLPSSREPWGLVVNEAMAAGLPVIVSRICGCADDLVQDGVNGFTFTSGPELAEILHRVSAKSTEELRAMGEQSERIISGYSPERWAEEVARLVSR